MDLLLYFLQGKHLNLRTRAYNEKALKLELA